MSVPENVVCEAQICSGLATIYVLLSFLAAQVMREKHAQFRDSQQQATLGLFEGVSCPSESEGDHRHL